MNLLILRPEDWLSESLTAVSGRRAEHLLKILKLQPGEELRVGALNGLVGRAQVLSIEQQPTRVLLETQLDTPPPPKAKTELLLALPRPKVLRRVLQAVASIGVARIVLVNAARVEKSYFDSPLLEPQALEDAMLLGLEQARDTQLPEIMIRKRFRPFLEDEAPTLWAGFHKLLAHPETPETSEPVDSPPSKHSGLHSAHSKPSPLPIEAPGLDSGRSLGKSEGRQILAIGPEGGWVPFEVNLLQKAGFTLLSASPRPLRVEVAIPYLLGMLNVREGAL